MDFNLEQRLAITKAIIELTDPLEISNLVEKESRINNLFEDSALIFYENNRRDVPTQHN